MTQIQTRNSKKISFKQIEKEKEKDCTTINEKNYNNNNSKEKIEKKNILFSETSIFAGKKNKKEILEEKNSTEKKNVVKDFHRQIISTINKLNNNCKEIDEALNLEKIVYKEIKQDKIFVENFNKDPGLNKILIEKVKDKNKKGFKNICKSSSNENINFNLDGISNKKMQFNLNIEENKKNEFKAIINYSDRLNSLNVDTIVKFKDTILNNAPILRQREKIKNRGISYDYLNHIKNIEFNTFLVRNKINKISKIIEEQQKEE